VSRMLGGIGRRDVGWPRDSGIQDSWEECALSMRKDSRVQIQGWRKGGRRGWGWG